MDDFEGSFARSDEIPERKTPPPRKTDPVKLAEISLIAAVVAFPVCVALLPALNRLINHLEWTYVAGARNRADEMGAWVPVAFFGAMGISTLLPMIALARAVWPRWNGRAALLAIIGLCASVFWWAFMYVAAQAAAAFGGRY